MIGGLTGYFLASKLVFNNDYACTLYKGQLENIEYIKPNYGLVLGSDDKHYFMDIDLNLNDEITFSGDEAYMSVS